MRVLMFYLVIYELRVQATPEEYDHVEAVLHGIGAPQIMELAWSVQSELAADELQQYLVTCTEPEDRFLIAEVTANTAHANLKTALS